MKIQRTTIPWLLSMAMVLPPSLPAQGIPDSAKVASATAAAESWLALVDEARYGQSWEKAAEAFRAAVTSAQWEAAVVQARGPLEPFGARTLLGARYTKELPNAPPGEYVLIQYRTAVSQDRMVVETVVPMLDPDGIWRVSGYFVRPE